MLQIVSKQLQGKQENRVMQARDLSRASWEQSPPLLQSKRFWHRLKTRVENSLQYAYCIT